jgi:hypothetical protein
LTEEGRTYCHGLFVRCGETRSQLPRNGLYRRCEMSFRISSGILKVKWEEEEYVQERRRQLNIYRKKSRKTCKIKIVDNTTGDGGELRSIIGPFTPVDQGSVRTSKTSTSSSSLKSIIIVNDNNKRSRRVLYHREKQWTIALGSIQAKYFFHRPHTNFYVKQNAKRYHSLSITCSLRNRLSVKSRSFSSHERHQ